MTYDDLIVRIENEWAPDEGFFWKAREVVFDREAFDRICCTLRDLNPADEALLPRRLVSLLWYAPIFLEWQRDRIPAVGGGRSEYERAVSYILNEVQRILGVP